jgi:hypothetical protein
MVKRRIPAKCLWMAAMLCAARPWAAQDAFTSSREAIAAGQPEGVKFELSAPKSDYYLGELIELDLTFTATRPKAFLASGGPRTGSRFGGMSEEFAVFPAALAVDPLAPTRIRLNGNVGGLWGGPEILSEKPFVVRLTLNEWLRFLKPGPYKVYAVSHRVKLIEDPARLDDYRRGLVAGKEVTLASNALTIHILTAPPGWAAERLAWARKTLAAPRTPSADARIDRLRAFRTLRFLDTRESASELARHLSEDYDEEAAAVYSGVLASAHRAPLLRLMEQRLIAPDQPAGSRLLDALAQLAELAASGPMAPFPKAEAEQKAWQDETRRRAKLQEQKRDAYGARLAAALPGKQPEVRMAALSALLNLAAQRNPDPPWLRTVAAFVASNIVKWPREQQTALLGSYWRAIKGPAMLPVLRELLAAGPQRQDSNLRSYAASRLYELAPAEGRALILGEIRQPTRWLMFSTLSALPDAELPELDGAMLARFDERLLLRYATGAIVKEVERKYLEEKERRTSRGYRGCVAPLRFYFLKFDPPFGERELREELAASGMPPVCYDLAEQFRDLGPWAYSPALERVAIESLSSPNVAVKRGAAELLGLYGSVAARKPLWDSMQYFHAWWYGKEALLNQMQHSGSRQLEMSLWSALGRGAGWALPETELRSLLSLCTTEWCRRDVAGWAARGKQPLEISLSPAAEGFGYSLAQYGPLSAEELRRKVAQYPAETAFKVTPWTASSPARGAAEAQQRAAEIVRAAGRQLAP